MVRRLPVLVLVITGVILIGCDGAKYVSEGDARMLSDEPARALASYRKALEKEPSLAEDPEFRRKLGAARGAVLYYQARTLMEQERWDDAVDRLHESLEADHASERARSALAHAGEEASKTHYERALHHADRGELDEAIGELEDALQRDLSNLNAKRALDSVSQEAPAKESEARAPYERSRALAAERRWLECSEALREALAADANHLPSRLALHEAGQALDTARRLTDTGRRLLDSRSLDESVEALESALDTWPYNEDAQAALAEARERRRQAEEAYTEGSRLLDEQRWDDSVVSLKRAADLYPGHPRAAELLAVARERAASAHCDRGDLRRAGGELESAAGEYRAALRFRPRFDRAHSGLGEVTFALGSAFEEAGRWGGALLSYLESADHAPTLEATEKVALARSVVIDRVRFDVAVVCDGGPRDCSESLESTLLYRLSELSPSYFGLATGPRTGVEYRAEVFLTKCDVSSRLLSSANRRHRYTVYRHVRNPALPRALAALDRAQDELRRLRRLDARRCPACHGRGVVTCPNCHGTGRVACRQCNGTGELPCGACRGTGYRRGDESLGPCPQCGGTGKKVCWKCRGEGSHGCAICGSLRGTSSGKAKCERCDGRGHGTPALRSRISRQEREVHDLEWKVRRIPTTVRQSFPADWPYLRRTYEKDAQLTGTCHVTDGATGRVIFSRPVGKSVTARDSTIEGANPDIGLYEDPLDLPGDESMLQSVINQAGAQLSDEVQEAVIEARLAEVRTHADALARAGDADASLEAYADYVCLLQEVRPDEAARFRGELARNLLWAARSP